MAWGDGSHYYAGDQRDATRIDGVARRWSQELLNVNPQARAEVERAVKQWNAAIRDQLRNETGLRLSVPGDTKAVPVRVMDGLPVPLYNFFDQLPELAFLLLWLSEIEQARRGTAFLHREYQTISRLVPEAAEKASAEDVGRTKELAEALLARLAQLNFKEQWQDIHQDLLGAYFFNVPVIHLYWIPIGLMAAVLKMPVERLATVVLAHELAHAYTHLGLDIDRIRWDTAAFASADLEIVEGLAEFYCRVVCQNLDDRWHGLGAAFDRFSEWSSGPYLAYKPWLEGPGDPGEIVRTTMVECRRTAIKKAEAFESIRKEYQRNLTGQRVKGGAAGPAGHW